MREYCRNVWLGFYTVLLGMKVTLKYLFAPAITLQYPDEKWEIPDGNRGKLDVSLDECIGCLQCSRACPPECITIEAKKAPPGVDMGQTSDGTKKKMVVPVFDIDLTKCLYCGLCVEACPTDSIKMTKEYEYSVYDKTELQLSFGKDLAPAVVAAAAEKVAAEKAAAEKAEAEKPAAEKAAEEKAEAAAGASEKPTAKADAGEPAGAEKPTPETKASAGELSGKAKPEQPDGSASADEEKTSSPGDKTPTPPGDPETPSE